MPFVWEWATWIGGRDDPRTRRRWCRHCDDGTGLSSGAVVIRLARAGVVVCAGSDGIRDTWGPYGNADMLERAMFIGLRSNLRRDDDLRIALDIVTTGGATALGLPDYGLTPGCVGCGRDGGRGCGPAAGDANGRKTWACYCPGRTSRSGWLVSIARALS